MLAYSDDDLIMLAASSSSSNVNVCEMYSDAFPSEGEIFVSEADGRPKAIGAFSPPPSLTRQLHMPVLEKQQQSFSAYSAPTSSSVFDFTISPALFKENSQSKSTSDAPSKPLFLLPNNFSTNLPLQQVVDSIHSLFEKEFSKDISYSFDSALCTFEGVFVRGAIYSDFTLHIYENTGMGGLLIEAQRMGCNSCCTAFHIVYDAVKRALERFDSPSSSMDLQDQYYDLSLLDASSGANPPTDDEITASIQIVLAMARSENTLTQLEAARMSCDLAKEPAYLQRLAECGGIDALLTLVRSGDVLVLQHAVLALAKLSVDYACAVAMIEGGALPLLMSASFGNGDFKTVSYRREAARILANIVSAKADVAARAVKVEVLREWIARIPTIADREIQSSCERAKALLLAF